MILLNRLKSRRMQREWSQGELALKAGISRAAVSAIEGQRMVPSVAAALALANALGCKVEDLFGPEKAKPPEEPTWAWPPFQTPCRYWQARIGSHVFLFPTEPSEAGLLEHDGFFANEEFRLRSPFDPDKTLLMASCDPAVGLLVRQLAQAAGIRLIVLTRSSREALALLRQGLIHVAGVHLAAVDSPGGNSQVVRSELGAGFSLLHLAYWQEGLAVAPHLGLQTLRAAVQAKLRWVGREPGSGARACLDELLGNRPAPRRVVRNHRAVAEIIRCGWADAGVCLRLAGEEANLGFIPIREEIFDLCFQTDAAGDPRIDALCKTVRSVTYRRLLGDLPGYDASATGELENLN